MSVSSTIEWTESTWNPSTGCTKVSPGCAHCYAETFAERFRGVPGHPYEQGFDLKIWDDRLELPLSWKKPRIIFVNSMSDLFHPEIPFTFIASVFETMRLAYWHTFQVLTKRPEIALEMSRQLSWPKNIWMGVSVETQQYFTRINTLRKIPAEVRFISCEPLLGTLDGIDLTDIDWVIAGGESGYGARPMKPEWARNLRDTCKSVGVPFFFKQWGAFNEIGLRVGKKKAGRVIDGEFWNEMPQGFQMKNAVQPEAPNVTDVPLFQ